MSTRAIRVATVGVAVVTGLGIAFGAWLTLRGPQVVAYNGGDEVLSVRVGGDVLHIPPHTAIRVPSRAAYEVLREGAAWRVIEVDLPTDGLMVIDPDARGVFVDGWDAPAGVRVKRDRILHAAEVHQLADYDRVLDLEPPRRQREHVLYALDSRMSLEGVVDALVEAGQVDRARERAVTALGVGGAAPEVQRALARAWGDDRGLVEILRSHRDANPASIDAHRAYQDAVRGDPALVASYRARADAQPEDPAALYLLGRLLPPAEARPWFEAALALRDPPAETWLGLAWAHGRTGAFPEALEALEAFARAQPDRAGEVLASRVRLMRALDRDPRPLLAGDVAGAAWMRAALDASDRRDWDRDWWTTDTVEADREPAEAWLFLAAGDVDEARVRLRGLSTSAEGALSARVALALSDGAPPEEAAAVVAAARPALIRLARSHTGRPLVAALALRSGDVVLTTEVDLDRQGLFEADPLGEGPDVAWAWYAAVAAVTDASTPAGAGARRAARRWMLPGEGPWFSAADPSPTEP